MIKKLIIAVLLLSSLALADTFDRYRADFTLSAKCNGATGCLRVDETVRAARPTAF